VSDPIPFREPDHAQLVAAEAAELAARARMLLPRLVATTTDPEPVSTAAAAAILLDDLADWLDPQDPRDAGPVHRRCGRRHGFDQQCAEVAS
jgi:hypothetical protein